MKAPTPGCVVCGRDNDNATHSALEATGHLSHTYQTPREMDVFQSEVHAWCVRNFGEQSDLVLYGGTAEETGEMLRGAVKREQGIRGTREEWDAEIRKEMGDIVIKLASIAGKEGWNLADIIAARWADVSKRVWSGPDKTGHGLPSEDIS